MSVKRPPAAAKKGRVIPAESPSPRGRERPHWLRDWEYFKAATEVSQALQRAGQLLALGLAAVVAVAYLIDRALKAHLAEHHKAK